MGFFKGKNIYDEYNTYGVGWTEDEYIFYTNGVETARMSFSKGVCDVNEEDMTKEKPQVLENLR